MGTKNEPGTFDCYANALPDEPIFSLLGRDPSAPDLVNRWAAARANEILAGRRPSSDAAMVDEAESCATAMAAWRAANWPARKGEKVEPSAAVLAERERIAAAIDYEAQICPCAEDAKVLHDTANLIRADFSYEGAEQIERAQADRDKAHDARVSELLAANNREVERRRAAEAALSK